MGRSVNVSNSGNMLLSDAATLHRAALCRNYAIDRNVLQLIPKGTVGVACRDVARKLTVQEIADDIGQGDIPGLTVPDGPFDLVIAIDHRLKASAVPAFLGMIKGLVSEGGVAIVAVEPPAANGDGELPIPSSDHFAYIDPVAQGQARFLVLSPADRSIRLENADSYLSYVAAEPSSATFPLENGFLPIDHAQALVLICSDSPLRHPTNICSVYAVADEDPGEDALASDAYGLALLAQMAASLCDRQVAHDVDAIATALADLANERIRTETRLREAEAARARSDAAASDTEALRRALDEATERLSVLAAAEEDAARLREVEQSLRSQLSRLAAELETSEQDLLALAQTAENEIRQQRTEIADFSQAQAQSTDRIAELETDATELLQYIEAMEETLRLKNSHIEEQFQGLEYAKRSHQALSDHVRGVEEVAQAARQSADAFEVRLNEEMAESERARQRAEQLNARLVELEGQLAGATQSAEGLMARIGMVENEAAEAKRAESHLTDQVRGMEEVAQAARQSADELEVRLNEEKAESERARQRAEQLNARLVELEEQLAGATQSAEGLMARIGMVENEAAEAKRAESHLTDQVRGMEEVAQAARQSADAFEVRLNEEMAESERARQRAEQLNARLVELEVVTSAATRDKDLLTGRLREVEEKNLALESRLEREIQHLSANLVARERDRETEKAALKSELAERATQVEIEKRSNNRTLRSLRSVALRAGKQTEVQHKVARASALVRQVLSATPPPPPIRATSLSVVQVATLLRLGLFDRDWYGAKYGVSPGQAWLHFMAKGAARCNDPNALFDGRWIAQTRPELVRNAMPLAAYLADKDRATISPHPLFDVEYYTRLYEKVSQSRLEPLIHYLRKGQRAGHATHPLIDIGWIKRTWPEKEDTVFSLTRYVSDPDWFGLDPHPMFSASYYLAENPHVAASGINPLVHYLTSGWREGRSPHPDFHNDWYLAENPDVLKSGVNPLVHYVGFGGFEDRAISPAFDQRYYLARYPDIAQSGVAPLAHYLAHGRQENRAFNSEQDYSITITSLLSGNVNAAASIAEMIENQMNGVSDATAPIPVESGETWPPAPLNDYWLPQKLRDYLIESFGEESIPLYWYLFSVIALYAGDADGFGQSKELDVLRSRICRLSEARATAQNGTPKDASIIIPVYNNLLDTMVSLVSVLELAKEGSFEIIVADDQSSDRTAEVIGGIGGVVRHVRHDRNLGFLLNCNEAARHAVGRIIILLNNDTVVLPGWLQGLLAGIDDNDNVGFVGSKLLNWDGTLQEAGGIIWDDGSGWNFGRNQDPLDSQFNYVKEVDYVSGASIAIPAVIWRELSGFDPIYAPAYYEDTDIAFRIRQLGYRTLYHPLSQVVHHEGRSHGTDVTSGVKAYQVRNQQIMLDRWRSEFERSHWPNAVNVATARDRSRDRPHILIVDHYVPQWDRDAGSRSTYHYIRMFLNSGFQVTFWPDNLWRDPEYTTRLQHMGVEVIYGNNYVGRFAAWLGEDGRKFDYIFLSRPHIACNYLEAAASHGAKLLYYGHDLHYMRMEAQKALHDSEVSDEQIEAMKAQELALCSRSDLFMFPSAFEIEAVAREIGREGHGLAIPLNIFEDEEVWDVKPEALHRRVGTDILFVGGFAHRPNEDGVRWFVNEILPKLREYNPDYRLKIVGSSPTSEIMALASACVEVCGRVSDEELDLLYSDCGIAVAPLRYGGGMKGKVIEALKHGIPLVTTSVGMQGLSDPDSIAWVADTADEMAHAFQRLAADPAETLRRVENGIDYIRKEFTLGAARNKLSSYLPELAPIGH